MTVQELSVAQLYANESGALRRQLARRLGNQEEAEDVMQDAYLRMLTLPSDHTALRCPRAFLFTIASNLVVEFIRREQRKHRLYTLIPNLEIVLDDDHYDIVCPLCPVDDQVDAMLRLSNVIDALDGLPESCQRAFIRHKFFQLSYSEVAEEMGVTVSMVEKHISRGLRHLREQEGCTN